METSIFLNKRPNSYEVYVVVTHCGQSAMIPTRMFVDMADVRDGMIISFPTRCKAYKLAKEVKDVYASFGKSENRTAADIVSMVGPTMQKRWFEQTLPTFNAFVKHIADGLAACQKKRASAYYQLLSKLSLFSKCEIEFADLNPQFIDQFRDFVMKPHASIRTNSKGQQTIVRHPGIGNVTFNGYLRSMRCLINKAKSTYEERGILVKNNLFDIIKIGRDKSDATERSLSVDEMKKIIAFKPSTDMERLSRALFLFSFFMCGLNMKDICNLSAKSFSNGTITVERAKIKDMKGHSAVVCYKQVGKVLDLLLPFYAEGHYVFEVRNEHECHYLLKKINRGLRSIAKKARIDKHFTFYNARHTFASICMQLNIPQEYISLCLVHTSVKDATDFYIKPDFTPIWETQQKVYDYFAKKTSLFSNKKRYLKKVGG